MSGDSDSSPANGMRKKRMLTPAMDRMLAEKHGAGDLGGGRHVAEVVELADREHHERAEGHAQRDRAGVEHGGEVGSCARRRRGPRGSRAGSPRRRGSPWAGCAPVVRRASGPRRCGRRGSAEQRGGEQRDQRGHEDDRHELPQVLRHGCRSGVRRELGAERRRPRRAPRRARPRRLAAHEHAVDELGDRRHLGSPHALRGDGRRADPQAGRDVGRTGIVRDGVLVEADAGPIEGEAGLLARQVLVEDCGGRPASGGCRCRPTRAAGRGRPGASARACRVAHDLGGVLLELRRHGLREGDGLGRDDVVERAALQAGEHRLVDGLRQLGRAQDRARHADPAGSCAS